VSHDALGERQLDALREVGNIGAGTAATALSRMVGTPVHIGIPRVSLLPVERVADHVGGGESVVAAVLLEVTGDAPGHMLVLMREAAAHRLAAVLMGRAGAGPRPPGPFTEMELSALQEVGNVLTSAYLGALSQLTGLRLEPTPPAVGVDMAGALVGAALAEVALTSPTALLIDSGFGGDGEDAAGDVLFLPTEEGLATVLGRLGLA
jgi:chemotaxis protein CheC